jgi:methyl-accepting chemotaxis protein PixJ
MNITEKIEQSLERTSKPLSEVVGATSQKTQPKSKIGLRTLLILPIVIPIAAIAAVSFLSIRNSRESVNQVAGELRTEISTRIENNLQSFLEPARLNNRVRQVAISLGQLNPEKIDTWTPYLYQLLKQFPTISGHNVGTAQRDFRSATRLENGTVIISVANQSTGYAFRQFQIDAQGNPTTFEDTAKDFDPRVRPWYKAAAKAGKQVWSPPFVRIGETGVQLSNATPIYDNQGKIQGVISSNLRLNIISNFLSNLKIGQTGQAFVMENTGTFIATSTDEQTYKVEGDKSKLIKATESQNPITKAAATYLTTKFGDTTQIKAAQQLEFTADGKEQFLQVTPVKDENGLDWLIVVTIPKNDFLGQANTNTAITIGLSLLAMAIAAAIGIFISRRIASSIERLNEATQAIASGDLDQKVESQVAEIDNLAQSFNQMSEQLKLSFTNTDRRTVEVQEMSVQVQSDSERLQNDVEQLLDVVSAMEGGDLTVQAEVSDRATGLVSDTLNRLVEELAKVMSTVLSTAQQVNKSADDLKQLSTTTTSQIEQQTQSVEQVQALMTNVTNLAQNTAQQSVVSEEAVQDAQNAVVQGQQEITAMARAIGLLQQNTEQIVRRSQLLTDYVTLASQFSNDQKKVASMTRVLALNASMVATRASDERDPEQFASIAREFEALATQVNDLATQTNQSLIVLQQRTDQIQTVVSGVSQDVQDISSSVNQFTQNVDRSRQVFDIIKSVTERVAEAEQELAQSSQAIATAAKTTLDAVGNIAIAATKTELQSRFTREQAEWMDKLAYSLLERVQFFRLPSGMVGSEMETEFLIAADDDTQPEVSKTKLATEKTMPIEVLNGDISYREWVTANQA